MTFTDFQNPFLFSITCLRIKYDHNFVQKSCYFLKQEVVFMLNIKRPSFLDLLRDFTSCLSVLVCEKCKQHSVRGSYCEMVRKKVPSQIKITLNIHLTLNYNKSSCEVSFIQKYSNCKIKKLLLIIIITHI